MIKKKLWKEKDKMNDREKQKKMEKFQKNKNEFWTI